VPAYVTAYEHFNEHRSILKMTTGSANLDSLIDSIQEGQFYLFYGGNKAVLDGLVHGLLVNCVLPKQKHGFESMVLYINNTDYYQPDKSKTLSPERIANTAKCMGIEPKVVFKNIFVQIAYNQKHQLAIAKQVADFITTRNQDIRLLLINNLTKYFKESKYKKYAASILKEVIGILSKVCVQNRVALICTGDANATSKGLVPRPIGGTYLKHAFNVIVCLRESISHPQAYKATLIKHQYSKTPKSVLLNTMKASRMLLLLDGS
jgi:RecA/RadA recombinase